MKTSNEVLASIYETIKWRNTGSKPVTDAEIVAAVAEMTSTYLGLPDPIMLSTSGKKSA